MTDPTSTASSVAVDPASPDARTQSSGEASSRRRWLLVALLGTLVVLSLAALVLAWQLRQANAEEEARQDALRYAKQTAVNLTSISFQDLDNDIQQVIDSATGEFEEDFASRSDNLREVLTTNQVVSEGTVLEAALTRADEDTATALLVVDATVRNTENPDGGVNTYRMKLELERQGDQWLTSMLEFVG